jgi:MauM/NapG family ferredoxin protein
MQYPLCKSLIFMKIKPYLKQVRRLSQLICLVIFLFLFRQTEYTGSDTIPYAVNILFMLVHLVLARRTLAQKTFVTLLWPSFIIIGLTLLFGRCFCSWICPLGTLIDGSGHFIKPGKASVSLPYLKYVILIIVLISSVFGVQVLGFVDPFSLLVRGMVFSVDPIINYLVSLVFDSIYTMGPAVLSDYTEPLYEGFKTFVLPFKQSFFYLSFLSFFLLVFIFIIEFFGKRFWCKNLCPLGGLLALISRISIFKFSIPKNNTQININRRQMIAAGLTGLALPVLSRTSAMSKMSYDDLIRPPGALPEIDFLASCVRCGECMKVCINNALQPLFMEKSLEGVFTPKLVPRLGYCEFNCTLCTQVCPTGALEKLNVKQKHAFVIGKAYFDTDKCLVYAQKKSCIVCEEHCPTHDKAIKFNEIKTRDFQGNSIVLKQPYVKEELCIGCGICEHICPVQGSSAIRVVGKGIKEAFKSGY